MSSLHHILYTLRASSSTKRLFSSYLSFECVFLATFCLYLLNTQKSPQKREKTSQNFWQTCWFIFISNNHSVLCHIQHFLRRTKSTYHLARKAYSNFYTLQLSNFFAIYNSFFYSFIQIYSLQDKVLARFPWTSTDKQSHHIQQFWTTIKNVYPLVHKTYRNFRNLQLSKIFRV